MKPKNKYRTVSVTLTLTTAADIEYLNSREEWSRVFRWMKPGDASTDQEQFEVQKVSTRDF